MSNINGLKVYSPLEGEVVDITNVPDPAFSEKMLGDGIAVNPKENFIYAPCDGVIKTLQKTLHAFVIESQGTEILVHIGVETVNLKGKGFKSFCSQGQNVKKGDKLLEIDRDFIAKNAESNLVILIVANRPEEPLNKTKAAYVKSGDELFSLGAQQEQVAEEQIPENINEILSPVIKVHNKNGFHARPASVIAKLASGFKGTHIAVIKNNMRANAKSMVEILGLSIDFNDDIQVATSGKNSEVALREISSAIIKGLNEGPAPVSLKQDVKPKTYDFSGEVTIKGVTVFPDLAIGKSFVMLKKEIIVEENASDAKVESAKLAAAIEEVKDDLQKDIAACDAHKNRSEILKAHLSMLEDPFLEETAAELISGGKSAGYAFRAAIKKSIEVLNSTGNALLKERGADFTDIENRVLMKLNGIKTEMPDFPKDTVLVVKDLLSYELNLLGKNVVGVIMAAGSPTSHVSIMLRNMGIASVIGAGEGALTIPQGSDIILNSKNGIITVNPKNIEEVKKEKAEKEKVRALNRSHCFEPAITKDGAEIFVKGNVGTLKEAENAASLGSQGIGLVRSEFLFAQAQEAPDEETQYKLYQQITDTQKGQSVIIRTLDVGGDKPLSYMPLPKEENPIVGLRGVRNYRLNLDIFKAQVRAIMRVNPHGTAKIMLPMVGFIDELWFFKRIVMAEQEKLGIKEVSMGIMIEVPSAAVLAAEFARHVDFFSIGTNDLTQYTLAIDRGHSILSPLADSLNPAVLKLIEMTVQGGAKHGKPVGVCGAMASDLAAVPVLLGLGIRELGVVSALIPDVKAFIRTLDMGKCQNIARLALGMQEAAQVREMIKAQFKL